MNPWLYDLWSNGVIFWFYDLWQQGGVVFVLTLLIMVPWVITLRQFKPDEYKTHQRLTMTHATTMLVDHTQQVAVSMKHDAPRTVQIQIQGGVIESVITTENDIEIKLR